MGPIETEGALVAARGLRYVNIPVDFMRPTREDYRSFAKAVKGSGGKKILVHCQAKLRASSFIFLYRVIEQGAPVNDAVALLTGVWEADGVWKKFIEDTLAAHRKKAEIL